MFKKNIVKRLNCKLKKGIFIEKNTKELLKVLTGSYLFKVLKK